MGLFSPHRKVISAISRMLYSCIAFFLLLILLPQAHAEKEVIGWLEKVLIVDPDFNVKLRAKLDTGAKSSSLHARNIEYFKKDGDLWVRFDFSWNKGSERIDRIQLEYPLKDHVRIRRHNIDSHYRPVIDLTICMGDTLHHIDVNLISRTRFNYAMLIGREVLKGKYLIDPDSVFTAKPKCKKKTETTEEGDVNDVSEVDENTENKDHQDNP